MVFVSKDKLRFLSYLSRSSLESIISSSSSTKTKLIVRLLYQTGISVKELTQLKPSNIKRKTIETLQQTKELSEELYKEILEFIVFEGIDSRKYIFSGKEKPISTKRIEQLCKGISPDKKITPKILKDSFVINNLETIKENKRTIEVKQHNKTIKKIAEPRARLIAELLYEGYSVERITSIENDDQEISNKYPKLYKELISENKNHRNEFLLSLRKTKLSRRRVEQILSEYNLTIKDIQRSAVAERLVQRAREEISEPESKEQYETMLSENKLVVRNAGFLEVYLWNK